MGSSKESTLLRRVGQKRNNIPPYTPTDAQWTMVFAALGWDKCLIERFWAVFCRINKSLDGFITLAEFLDYFDLAQTPYVDKCFSYFDTSATGTISFVEFVVSIWNVCTMKVDTLTNFAFELFDLDSDGELSFPEIDCMIEQLYGEDGVKSGVGKKTMDDIAAFTEKRGGRLRLADFTIYTATHQLIMFPIFQIQWSIQCKVMGESYWRQVERKRPIASSNKGNAFNPRSVHEFLRTYKKTGAAVDADTNTRDGNQGLRELFEKQNDELPFLEQAEAERSTSAKRKYGWKRVGALLKKDGRQENRPRPPLISAVEASVTSSRRGSVRNIAEKAYAMLRKKREGS